MHDADAAPLWDFQSVMPGTVWPAVPAPTGAAVLSLLLQLEDSQWLPPERLLGLQLRQLESLLRHAYATVPFYRERWRGRYDPATPLTMERLAALPVLARRELQLHFEALRSERVPARTGAAREIRTSGATGALVRVLKTPLDGLFWSAFTLRDHRWHRRDLARTLAVIRHGPKPGQAETWGRATVGIVATGRAVTLGVATDVEAQLEWLERQQAGYLLTYPSIVAELAKASLRRGVRLPGLLEVRTVSELLAPDVRELCRQAWGVPVTDTYSANEVGYIALQCPAHAHYHVQSEGVLLEILDERDRPCAPGQPGRVVVTSLQSFAMPLVRYEIGDYAETGESCPCGRGLPVVGRILGRVRNTLVTADGRRYWPTFGQRAFLEIAPVLQHQFVQKAYDLVEARLVTSVPLSAEQEEGLRRRMLSRLPPGFRVSLVYVEAIARIAGGKFEDFISEVTAGAR